MSADLSAVRAIYFDLDDTLCGYWDACKAALRIAFQQHPAGDADPETMVRHWAAAFRVFGKNLKQTHWYPVYLKTGKPTRIEQMRLMLESFDIHDQDHAERLAETYSVERDRALRLFPESHEVLELLTGRYPMGLITNGPADIQRQEINTLGIEHFFDHIYIEGELGEGKPLPSVFERARRAVGCEPHQVLMVGNSYGHDIKGAIEAGWRTVWIRRSSDVPPSADGNAQPEERPEGDPAPDMVIGDLREFLPALG
ncbi:MAG: HAD family hydrolase [Chthonomonas sp.]|nr:HAD family hydrolase [Chthonomonas sp.]